MFLADYHMHTTFSHDAEDTMEAMAAASLEKGGTHICFTDHVDNCCANDPVDDAVRPFTAWDERAAEFARIKDKFADKIDIRFGAEVSTGNHMPGLAKDLYENYGFDFVIGSVHNLIDTDDFYFLKYTSSQQCRDLNERYFKEHIELANVGYFDVLGHIGYTGRYMSRQGFRVNIMDYSDYLEELFSVIVPKGLGIEVNTSGMRDALCSPIPSADVLKLYREMGGEIITVGSDSHRVQDACAGISDVYDILRNVGFKYVSIFSNHKPEFIKI